MTDKFGAIQILLIHRDADFVFVRQDGHKPRKLAFRNLGDYLLQIIDAGYLVQKQGDRIVAMHQNALDAAKERMRAKGYDVEHYADAAQKAIEEE